MGFYLLDHPNRTPQYGAKRRGGHKPSGTIVIHTAENVADQVGADLGAENVARYCTTRSDYGSYHRIVDSDSIVAMAPFGYETWHCRVTNPWSIGISMAVRADDWGRYSADYVTRVLRNAAKASAEAVRDLKKHWNVDVPIAHITGSDARRQRPGFTGHGETDPGRRHDPGAGFPWGRFLRMVGEELDREPEDDGAEQVSNPVKPSRPAGKLAVDGIWGSATTAALQRALGTPADGIVSSQSATWRDRNAGLTTGWQWVRSPRGSKAIAALQRRLGVKADGLIGPATIRALQKRLGTPVDGEIWRPSSAVRALQRTLNEGKLP